MIVTIHQPEYMPWLGLLDKARRADVFVILDDVQFNRASLQHRCKIASPKAPFSWLTIPFVHRFPQDIKDVQVAGQAWPERHLAMLREGYPNAPAAEAVLAQLREFYGVQYGTVSEAARASMKLLFRAFGVETCTVPSSSLAAEGAKGDRVLDLCRRAGATRYLSGKSGAEYLDRAAFEAAGIEIEVQEFTVPRYREGQPDVPGLSALDAWMYHGDRASSILDNKKDVPHGTST